jgi:hypothetical protein
MSQVATLIEDRASVVSLGEPRRFFWIDVPGAPASIISAYVIGELEPGPLGDGEALLLATRSTVEAMAAAVRVAQLTEDFESWAQVIEAVGPAFSSPVGDLFDITELGGGAPQWADQLIVDGDVAGQSAPPDALVAAGEALLEAMATFVAELGGVPALSARGAAVTRFEVATHLAARSSFLGDAIRELIAPGAGHELHGGAAGSFAAEGCEPCQRIDARG